jgi:hypothetical protein
MSKTTNAVLLDKTHTRAIAMDDDSEEPSSKCSEYCPVPEWSYTSSHDAIATHHSGRTCASARGHLTRAHGQTEMPLSGRRPSDHPCLARPPYTGRLGLDTCKTSIESLHRTHITSQRIALNNITLLDSWCGSTLDGRRFNSGVKHRCGADCENHTAALPAASFTHLHKA